MKLNDTEGIKKRLFSKREIKPSPDGRHQDCWIWNGNKHENGYGQTIIQYKRYYVHRLSAYLYLNLELLSDLCVCHKCDNRLCFNPDHLFIGSRIENNIDRDSKERTAKGDQVRNKHTWWLDV